MDGTGLEVGTSSVVISVETDEFMRLLKEAGNPVVIHQPSKWWQPYNRYLLTYRGMTFYTRTKEELVISKYADTVQAKSFYVPGVC